jgi:hypothetical protein
LDHTNANVWGYLCLVSLMSSRGVEAEQALGMAFKVNLTDADLLAEVGPATYPLSSPTDCYTCVRLIFQVLTIKQSQSRPPV